MTKTHDKIVKAYAKKKKIHESEVVRGLIENLIIK